MSSNLYSQTLETKQELEEAINLEPPAPLDLELIDPIITNINGIEMFSWDIEGYRTILNIYTGYDLWAATYYSERDDDLHFQLRLDLCESRVQLTKEAITLSEQDRTFAYKQFNNSIKSIKDIEKKNKLRNILIGTGSTTVGIAIGIIVGIVFIK